MIGWRHAYSGLTPLVNQNFSVSPTSFAIAGTPLSETSLIVDAGVTLLNATKNTNLRLSYLGQFGNCSYDNAVAGRFSWAFD